MKVQPGPGKYETMDMMGSGKNFYNSRFKTQNQKSFNGGDRFSRCKIFLIQLKEHQGLQIIPLKTRLKRMEIVYYRQ